MRSNKVIAYSLWGDNPKYTVGAIRNAEIALTLYSDWDCMFFINEYTVPDNVVDTLKKMPNTILRPMTSTDTWANLFWRFQTCYDPSFVVSIFRDTDSRLSYREKYAVDHWLSQPQTFHIMRDHPHHGFPILGGMWGYKNNHKYNLKNLLENFSSTNRYGTDYEFLGKVLYPIIGNDKVVHDEFFDKKPFPTLRQDSEFVGDVFDENDNRHPEFHKFITAHNYAKI